MSYRVFWSDVTAAMCVSQTNPPGIELYPYANVFFSLTWKACSLIDHVTENTLYVINGLLFRCTHFRELTIMFSASFMYVACIYEWPPLYMENCNEKSSQQFVRWNQPSIRPCFVYCLLPCFQRQTLQLQHRKEYNNNTNLFCEYFPWFNCYSLPNQSWNAR